MYQINGRNVSLQYKNKKVLKDISFQLEGNKIYGLLGRNGAGKTTLLSLLATFQRVNEGEITANGKAIFENREYVESVVFIRDEKFDDLQAEQKVKHWLRGQSLFRPNFDKDYADKLMKRFKIPMNQSVSELSRGKQSALHVVSGLASRAPITIFDEAYLGMDAPAREMFYEEVLQDYMEYPRTIILSTHLISEMESMFEEVLIIDRGQLLVHEEVDSLRSKGTSLTGEKHIVNDFIQGKEILKEQVLGQTKRAMIFGELSAQERELAKTKNIEVGPVSLQELFIHLTKEEDEG